MKIEETSRGFEVICFEDKNGSECSLQQSSLSFYEQPGSSAIWFGREENRMHITDEQLKEILPHLQAWLKNGSFNLQEER